MSQPAIHDMRRLFRYVAPYRWLLIIASALFVISSGLFLAFPSISGQLVNAVTGAALPLSPTEIMLALVAVFVLRAIVDIVSQYLLSRAGESVTLDLRADVYRRLQSLGLSFYASRRTGELVSRLSSDVTVVRTTLVNNVATLLSNVLSIVGAAVLILIVNWRLTLVVLIVLPVATLIAVLYGRAIRPLSRQVQDKLAESSSVAEEAISGVRVVKSFERETYEVSRFEAAARATFQSALRLATIRATFGPLIGLMFFFALLAILWFGSQEVSAGRLSAGELVAFLLYGSIIASSVGVLAQIFSQLQEAVGATQRLFEILDTPCDVCDTPNAKPIGVAEGRITFEHVSFAYESGVEVVQDINLDIAPGEIIALVGPSGAGKSTLFNLIPRFYDPTSGAVKLDGIDLRNITLASLRANIGIVPQETVLFSGTVRENILYGRLDASEQEMMAAAKAANAHEFVLALPQGYDTPVGERGIKLSGGQRQRIAIARAVLKNPRVLLLDEATSSLDSESEGLVQEALGRLMQGRTTIIIAHRLSTVQIAHRIAVLDKGRLVELGTHDELLARDGLYRRLYLLQFAVADEDTAPPLPDSRLDNAADMSPAPTSRQFSALLRSR